MGIKTDSLTPVTSEPSATAPVRVQPDCSALRRYLEVVAHENRGGNYRRHPIEGELECQSKYALRALGEVEYALEQIAKAQNK